MAAKRASLKQVATMLDLSPQTLTRILNGSDISENMLFRLRNSMEYASQHPGISLQKDEEVYPGDWRGTQKQSVQEAIGVVTGNLIVLRDAITASNSINGPNAPIDPLQVAQLVALLNSMLSALQAPFVEARQAGGFFRWLASVAKGGAQKGIEENISKAFNAAIAAGKKLIEALLDSSGPPDLGGFAP
jgi:transcriptional regulator with XRE-family HTH domain